jgi:hypothetical protein
MHSVRQDLAASAAAPAAIAGGTVWAWPNARLTLDCAVILAMQATPCSVAISISAPSNHDDAPILFRSAGVRPRYRGLRGLAYHRAYRGACRSFQANAGTRSRRCMATERPRPLFGTSPRLQASLPYGRIPLGGASVTGLRIAHQQLGPLPAQGDRIPYLPSGSRGAAPQLSQVRSDDLYRKGMLTEPPRVR